MKAALDVLHGGLVHGRRLRRLASLLAQHIPARAQLLDVGSGDGQLAAGLQQLRPDVTIRGVDVMVRPRTAIPVDAFDGRTLPLASRSVDVVTCIDVLHHADDAAQLLRECARVARRMVLVKDHLREGLLAVPTLRLMDWVGNARHGVALPYNYLSRAEWRALIPSCGLCVERWEEELGLYPGPAEWVFGRHLHVLATLTPVTA
ncbi:MAG: class I SAM-dependent methyltransferase [Gemmatimonadaceae bacterium]